MRNPVSHERNLIGGFLLMAGGVALLAYAHKLKQRLVGPDPALIADELTSPPGSSRRGSGGLDAGVSLSETSAAPHAYRVGCDT